MLRAAASSLVAFVIVLASGPAKADLPEPAPGGRYVYASVAALEQPIFYNRFGSFNPYGTIYALLRDVVDEHGRPVTTASPPDRVRGRVRLHDKRRPRPLVLRGNVGDILIVDFVNLLAPRQPDLDRCRGVSPYVPPDGLQTRADGDDCDWRPPYATLEDEAGDGADEAHSVNGNWPLTRTASIAAPGLEAVRCDGTAAAPEDLATGMRPVGPGESTRYCYRLRREGTFLFSSLGAPAGGEGDGGSLSHGLFGAVNVQPTGSRWYRSQVGADVLAATMRSAGRRAKGAVRPVIDYEAVDEAGVPHLAMLMAARLPDDPYQVVQELVHGDLTAIVDRCPRFTQGIDDRTCAYEEAPAVRDFTIVFHDELKTFYPDWLKELESEENAFPGVTGLGDGFNPLAGVRDGFAINYGASGMGSILLANRKGVGPAKDCVECAYEEFFLQSWANGDPALLTDYEDDPSNVYHSYLNDPIVFRNTHAGPKETHVFHLHAHQWLAERTEPGTPAPDGIRREPGTYLDSQTIAPMQGFTYEIYHGGSGNLNLTSGDSIFHCHLYPHFAQGMWALWRVHDVFEDGTRRLPDRQLGGGNLAADGSYRPRPEGGTPIPALVPLPGKALAPMPSPAFPGYPFYIAGKPGHRAPQAPKDLAADGGLPRHIVTGGARKVSGIPSQEVEQLKDEIKRSTGGDDPDALSVAAGAAVLRHALLTGDFSSELEQARIELLPDGGTRPEREAMRFHAAGTAGLTNAAGQKMEPKPLSPLDPLGLEQRLSSTGDPAALWRSRVAGYTSTTPDGREYEADGRTRVMFRVNGSTGKPGAPFADPCRDVPARPRMGWEAEPRITRYDVSAIKAPMVVNNQGWHDPQGHVNVLDKDAVRYAKAGTDRFGVGATADVKPFFFRAHSGDCIEFRHTNRLPKELRLDDFQVRTPTDTLGQHIHLVKFDVTASDGSGNGFNYEDGTFAKEAIAERLKAAGGAITGPKEQLQKLRRPEQAGFQTTIQRWYAEPLPTWAEDGDGKEVKADRTLRTVFTHDHFGPSSIQQHGFYSALLIEPRGSIWYENRVGVGDAKALLKPGEAVGTQALIANVSKADAALHGAEFREFALAVADFALLYDGRRETGGSSCSAADREGQGLSGVCRDLDTALAKRDTGLFPFLTEELAQRIKEDVVRYRQRHGRPVAPPKRPESISKDHHDPYLVNYRNEPLPLRIAEPDASGRWRIKPGEAGDLAFAFSSKVHPPPVTETFQAYENERVQMRLIQGAQEVQHVAQIQGMRWRREPGSLNSVLVGAQEIGISEHFEISIDRLPAAKRAFTDHLYSAGSLDALWNGAWGLIRVHDRPSILTNEPDRPVALAEVSKHAADTLNEMVGRARRSGSSSAESLVKTLAPPSNDQAPAEQASLFAANVAGALDHLPEAAREPTLVALESSSATAATTADNWLKTQMAAVEERNLDQVVRRRQSTIRDRNGQQAADLRDSDDGYLACPKEGPVVRFFVEAWPARDWLGSSGSAYAEGGRLVDIAALAYRLIYTDRPKALGAPLSNESVQQLIRGRDEARRADRMRGYVPPLVLRANAGECIQVVLTNCLLGEEPGSNGTPVCRTTGSVVDDVLSDRSFPPEAAVAHEPPRITPTNRHFVAGRPKGPTIDEGPGLLPRIIPINSQHVTPSRHVDIKPQLVTWDVVTADGIPVGMNDVTPLGPGLTSDRFVWYAGVVKTEECSPANSHRNAKEEYFWPCDFPNTGHHYYEFRPIPFGAVPLASFADVVEHGSQGLGGTLVVEPEGSRHLDVASGQRLDGPASAGGVAFATLRNGGAEALVKWREPSGTWAMPRHEFVLTFQDGLGLRFDPTWDVALPIPDCGICDDSYDLGEKGASNRAEPFWLRLGLDPVDVQRHEAVNLNRHEFPRTFFTSALDGSRPVATPALRAKAGELVSLRVTQPTGRARQQAFLLYGNDYPDLLPRHGSAGSALMAPGKSLNAHLCDQWGEPRRTDYGFETRICAAGGAHVGRWLWRNGPAQHFASGVWGTFIVD